MSSIIQELQIEAAENSVPVSDLLRKAKIITIKLDLKEFAEWIEKELNGYKVETQEELPDYRLVNGEVKALNPFRGWQPILFNDVEAAEIMAKRGVMQPIGELDDLLKSSNEGTFMIDYNAAAKKQIIEAIGFETDIKFMVGRSAVAGILEGVRNLILDWALKLEKAGILGEGVSFSKEDKVKAQNASTTYNIGHIGNFAGAIGNISESASVSVNQTNHIPIKEIDVLLQQIKSYLPMSGLSFEDSEKATQLSTVLEIEIKKSEPEQSKIKGTLSSLRNIFEGATGNVVAQGILFTISKLLGM